MRWARLSATNVAEWKELFAGPQWKEIPTRLPESAGTRMWVSLLVVLRMVIWICGCVWITVGFLHTASQLAGVPTGVAGRDADQLDLVAGLCTSLTVPALLFTIAIHLRNRIRRHSALPSERALSIDERPPVVLLRSFVDDTIRVPQPFWSLSTGVEGFYVVVAMLAISLAITLGILVVAHIGVAAALAILGAVLLAAVPVIVAIVYFRKSIKRAGRAVNFSNLSNPFRFEELVALANWSKGPVVAIGKPGEKLPLFGACREYWSDEEWQGRVLELLQRCARVVMIVGTTEALGWEIQQIVTGKLLHKTLFVLPPVEKHELQARLDRFKRLLRDLGVNGPMPEDPDKVLLIGFHANQTPFVITGHDRMPFYYQVAFFAAGQIQESNSQ